MLQKVLEKPLEKKAGRNFGPPGNKTMIYFVDDMNMPEVRSSIGNLLSDPTVHSKLIYRF
jgi:hypothetical protein